MLRRTTIARLVAVVIILLAAFGHEPVEARPSSSSSMCQVCTGGTICPVDLGDWDSACESRCGSGTYAGACRDSGSPGQIGCWGMLVAVVCYEPM